MKSPVIVWIVDDESFHAAAAWKAVEAVESSFEAGIKTYWAQKFTWDSTPILRENVDLKSPGVKSPYPDLVIMDLCFGNQEELQGDSFHRNLRDWEVKKSSGYPALVILWSIHQGKAVSERFVRAVIKGDPRVIPLASKQPELLEAKVRECLRRILEERED